MFSFVVFRKAKSHETIILYNSTDVSVPDTKTENEVGRTREFFVNFGEKNYELGQVFPKL